MLKKAVAEERTKEGPDCFPSGLSVTYRPRIGGVVCDVCITCGGFVAVSILREKSVALHAERIISGFNIVLTSLQKLQRPEFSRRSSWQVT